MNHSIKGSGLQNLSLTRIQKHVKPGHRLHRDDFVDLEVAFNLLPQVFFYVKDRTGRWVTCNNASLKLLRMVSQEEVVGAREEDFFPKKVADAIRKDDLAILETGSRITDRVELIVDEHGQLVWAKTSKIPVFNQVETVCGLLGMTSIIDQSAALPRQLERFRRVIRHVEERHDEPLKIPDLAKLAGLSESHFRRSFKEHLGISPQEFLLRQRLRTGARMLTDTDLSIASVALECGFGDQSYFNRQFSRFFGESPRKYRLRWRS